MNIVICPAKTRSSPLIVRHPNNTDVTVRVPQDRVYTREHFWLKRSRTHTPPVTRDSYLHKVDMGVYRVGITKVGLQWCLQEPVRVKMIHDSGGKECDLINKQDALGILTGPTGHDLTLALPFPAKIVTQSLDFCVWAKHQFPCAPKTRTIPFSDPYFNWVWEIVIPEWSGRLDGPADTPLLTPTEYATFLKDTLKSNT